MSDYFYQIDEESHYEIKIKNSRFIAHINNISSFEDSKSYISQINSEFKDATHNCWAYILGKTGEMFHSSDDGEPSGTAGKPILNTLQKYKMTNTVAVVTRYYGGVKLGVRGLIEAYSESVEECIKNSIIKPIIEIQSYKINLSYDKFDTVKYNLKNQDVEIKDIDYQDSITFLAEVEKNKSEPINKYLEELKNSNLLSFEYINNK
ncbi:MAG: YigZ family protein [Candidatus Sericytochromatia bacterium]